MFDFQQWIKIIFESLLEFSLKDFFVVVRNVPLVIHQVEHLEN